MSDVDVMVAWLRAQWDADEQAALNWPADERDWQTVGQRRLTYNNGSHEDVSAIDVSGAPVLWWERIYVKRDIDGLAEHIARHDPADTLARIDGERAVLAEHVPTEWPTAAPALCPTCADWRTDVAPEDAAASVKAPCPTLRALAYGYRHRAGWQEGWAP